MEPLTIKMSGWPSSSKSMKPAPHFTELVSLPSPAGAVTSANDEEILKMYKLRCSSYIVKPVDFEQFLRVIRSISEYWFTVVVVPTKASTEEATAHAGS